VITRRGFVKQSVAGIAGLTVTGSSNRARSAVSGAFSVHPFVTSNPNAVFIMRTNVDNKFDTEAKVKAGRDFSGSVFVSDDDGVPPDWKIALKANMLLGKERDPYPEGYLMGANTDTNFVEGVIEGMKDIGISEKRFYLRDTSSTEMELEGSGYKAMAERSGVNLLPRANVERDPDSCHWVDVPDGVIHRKIPYLWPFNAPETFLLNIAKFKSHAMGLTLCCKNIQGMVAHPYQGYCGGINGPERNCDKSTLNSDYVDIVTENHRRHEADGIPRWDKPGRHYNCGLGMETWVSRTLDNISASPMGLCVVEGIYGRDGSHANGPHPPFERNSEVRGRAHDYMSNIVFFGMNPFHVDIIGHWLGGHEPGNFGLFHIGRERGMSKFLDPHKIPVYAWKDGKPEESSLESFERTPLLTYYLRRNYNDQEEPVYHFCNEPYDYS